MRNRPRSLRNKLLIAGLIGASVTGIAIAYGGNQPLPIVAAVLGGITALIGLILGLLAQLEVRSLARLRDPANQIARWSIQPSVWAQFLECNTYWSSLPAVYRNHLDVSQSAPLEIIATRRSVLIGDDFYDIGLTASAGIHLVQFTNSTPTAIEVCGRTAGRHTSYPFAIRFPIDPSNPASAELVLNTWKAEFLNRPGAGMRNPRRSRNICLGLMFAGLVCSGVAISQGGGDSFTNMLASNWGALFALGFILFFLCGVLALVFQRAARKTAL